MSLLGSFVYQIVAGTTDSLVESGIRYLEDRNLIAPVSRKKGASVVAILKIAIASTVAHIVAYPFDSVCARLQTGEYSSILSCVSGIWDKEGM